MTTYTPAEARAMIGPEPPGDPDGMRGLAGDIRRVAYTLEARADIRMDNWESAAGRQVKAAIAGAAGRAAHAADTLRSAAQILEREADHVAAAKARWAARYSALINEDSGIPETKI